MSRTRDALAPDALVMVEASVMRQELPVERVEVFASLVALFLRHLVTVAPGVHEEQPP